MTVAVEVGAVVNDAVAGVVSSVRAEFSSGLFFGKYFSFAFAPCSVVFAGPDPGSARAYVFCFRVALIWTCLLFPGVAAAGYRIVVAVLFTGCIVSVRVASVRIA